MTASFNADQISISMNKDEFRSFRMFMWRANLAMCSRTEQRHFDELMDLIRENYERLEESVAAEKTRERIFKEMAARKICA